MDNSDFLRDTVRQLAMMVSKLAALVSEGDGERILTEPGEAERIALRAAYIAQMIEDGAGLP